MILKDNILVSDDVIEREFVCNIKKCKGACCIEGDFGAPLEKEEVVEIENILDKILPLITQKGRDQISEKGFYTRDKFGELVTELIDNKQCVFTVYENEIASCGIEKAFEKGIINYKKPISCHLYPIRIQKLKDIVALNYDRWDICSDACSLGRELKVPVYRFLKEPLIRKFGKKWYDEFVAEVEN